MRAAAAPETSAPALPPLFRHHVRRPRLTRLLDASKSRLILLTAPAGYGKTTLAAEWLQGRPAEQVAWYYAGPESADVAALSVGIAEAVSHILPAGDRVRTRLRVPQVPDNNAEILAELLAADLVKWPETAWLVIDDYHHAMESDSAERFVEELLRQAPIRVLITTRRRPSWVTARHVVYGDVLELTQGPLSMTRDEAARVLDVKPGDAAGPGADSSETWPALIGLAAISSSLEPWREHMSTVYRYLAEEVLSNAAPDERVFLLRAAIPPYLTPKVVTILQGRDSSVASDLQNQGLLNADPQGRLRLHPLLKEFLLARTLRRRHEGSALDRIARELAEAFIEDREWDAAFQVAVDTGEADLAALVVKRAGPALLQAGRLKTLDSWLKTAQSADDADPDTLLLVSEVALRNGSLSRAIASARLALDVLEPRDRRESAAQNLLGRALHMRCDHHAALRAYDAARKTASLPEDRLQAAWGRLIATVELGKEDPTTCLEDFASVTSTSPDHRLRLASGRMMVAERMGAKLPLKEHREAIALSEHAHEPMAISHLYATGIHAHARRGAYREALSVARVGIRYCKELHLAFPMAYCLAYRGQAEIGARQLQAARSTLAELAPSIRRIEDAHLRLVYQTLRVKLGIATGQISEKLASSSESHAETDVPEWPLADLAATEAVVLAALGKEDSVRERSRRIEALSRGPTAILSVDLAEMILASKHDLKDGNLSDDFEGLLRRLVRLQCQDTFVTAYRAYPRLLQIPIKSSTISRLVQSQIGRANDLRLADGTALMPARAGIHALTRREAEVASLVAAGLTNVDIANELFISLSTAKVHVHRVMKKLHARTRLEAALAWRAHTETTRQ